MRILSITAQKPNSTGSGVFLTELVRAISRFFSSMRVSGRSVRGRRICRQRSRKEEG